MASLAVHCVDSTAKQKHHHAVAIPLCAVGHMNPLMRFCKKLASSHGFTITFVDIDPIHHRRAELSPQDPLPRPVPDDQSTQPRSAPTAAQCPRDSPDIRRAHIPLDGVDLSEDFRLSLELLFEAQQRGLASPLEDLLRKLNRDGLPVTCLISDVTLIGPTQKVADMFNIPNIVFYTSSASTLLLSNYVLQGDAVSLKQALEALTRREDHREIFCEGLSGLPTIRSKDLPYYKHMVDNNDYVWRFTMHILEESNNRAHAMVVNSFEDLEPSAFKALSDHLRLPIYGVGPLMEPLSQESSTSLWKEDEACMLWLDKQPPLSVLYISFGSFTLLSQPQFEEFLGGLLSCQQRFLWVFRPDLVEKYPHCTDALELLSNAQSKGFVVEWAPQLRVLAHPSLGGFLTHCGWNSIIEGISHGVPMLCWPYFADQFMDAKYVVEEWKIGLQFESNKEGSLVGKDEIERVIRILMQDECGETMRKNALHIKEASQQSILPGGTTYKDIQALIQSLEE